jgi:sugar phosphate isomerase/epimerase
VLQDGSLLDKTLAPTLAALPEPPRRALDRLQASGYRAVQLSATQPGLRPRELDRSARRDLAATLRRRELAVAGIDAWLPAEHLRDAAHVDRAAAAVLAAIDLAGDLGGCPLSLSLADDIDGAVLDALVVRAADRAVALANHAVPPPPLAGVALGIDPAAWLADGGDPVARVVAAGAQVASARLVDLRATGLRGPIGAGADARLDVVAYRAALDVAGYRRPVVVDMRQWSDAWAGLEQTRGVWDSVFGGTG